MNLVNATVMRDQNLEGEIVKDNIVKNHVYT